MNKITNVTEAIIFLEKEVGISVEEVPNYKYRIFDKDIDNYIKDDEDLIEYANEQKEAIEE